MAQTRCEIEPGHESPDEGSDRHVVPFFEQLVNPEDVDFLRGLRKEI